MNRDKLKEQLTVDEGRRKRIYKDTVGKWTGGVGRNLSDRDFSDNEIDLMLDNDIRLVEAGLDKTLPWWRELNDVRQNVLANMAFNLGVVGLLGFRNTLKAIADERWEAAATGMLQSKWARQVGQRAVRLATMMRTGEWL